MERGITRRGFLASAGRVAVLLPAAGFLVRCGGDGDSGGGGALTDFSVTSSVESNHSHTVTIRATDLEDPPADGVSYASSTAGLHSHTVALSQTQLQDIVDGDTVVVTSSSDAAHTHTFTISRPR